ncbi:hypothetical protein C8R44DRAFT_886486 [Mycena epipterygia]|nr:hypothetical protein C8R44DRAFT_886486 [Mycena epipterygia]
MSETHSSENSFIKPSEADIKRWIRMDALERYEKKNSELLREKARVRMRSRRAEIKQSEKASKVTREHRRKSDAESRERLRRRKFIKKHGYVEFLDNYLPLLTEFNGFDLAGVKVATSSKRNGGDDNDDTEPDADEQTGGDK